jgi:hypothetical protein
VIGYLCSCFGLDVRRLKACILIEFTSPVNPHFGNFPVSGAMSSALYPRDIPKNRLIGPRQVFRKSPHLKRKIQAADFCDARVLFHMTAKLKQGDFADNFPVGS